MQPPTPRKPDPAVTASASTSTSTSANPPPSLDSAANSRQNRIIRACDLCRKRKVSDAVPASAINCCCSPSKP